MVKLFFPVACAALLLAGCDRKGQSSEPLPSDAVGIEPVEGKLLLMHYMPWYETPEVRGRWGSHWTGHAGQHDPSKTGEDGLPDIWSHFHPLIGLYDSTDPAVIECQLLQMKLAGVDGVIIDWYGIAPTADYPSIHEASRRMFEIAGRLGMRFAVCFEDRTYEYMVKTGDLSEDEIGSQLGETMAWLAKEWFPAPHYVRVNDRPLLMNFGPIHVKEPLVWAQALEGAPERPAFYTLHHLWRNAGADGGYTWAHPSAWTDGGGAEAKQRLDAVYRNVGDPSKVIVSALPGFKDVYENPHPVIEHRDGETMRESLEVCMEGPWETVQLVTWNDYGEGTMIEPTHEFGYRFLEIIQDARRKERGSTVASTDDLRLPARLLELRREGEIEARELDFIARLLASGSIDEARRRIESLSPDAS
ncbi:hypothetical protein [Haloferula sp.]|uniref:hypothetical protein n=1 Tax=Haloferula sp. TaxID=2497595 RepID=UPI003C71A7A8